MASCLTSHDDTRGPALPVVAWVDIYTQSSNNHTNYRS